MKYLFFLLVLLVLISGCTITINDNTLTDNNTANTDYIEPFSSSNNLTLVEPVVGCTGTNWSAPKSLMMAFILASSPDSTPASQEEMNKLRAAISLAQSKWNEMIPELRLTIDPLYELEVNHTLNPPGFEIIQQFYAEHPEWIETYDFISYMDTWTNQDWYCNHNTFLGKDINSVFNVTNSSLRAVNHFTSIHNPCGASSQTVQQLAYVIIHEAIHQWAVLLPESSLLDSFQVHWSEFVNTSYDPMGGFLYGNYESGTYSAIYGEPSNESYYFDNMKLHNFTLFQMGLINRNETGNITLMTNCSITAGPTICSSYRTYTINEVFPIDEAVIDPSNGNMIDRDGDGILNWAELEGTLGYKTDPLNADTNNNGIDDLTELQSGKNPSGCN